MEILRGKKERQKFIDDFKHVKEELDDHRESINGNTNEIQSTYEYICRIEAKLDKITERLDEISLMVTSKPKKKEYEVQSLTPREHDVFVALYTSENDFMTYKELSRRTGLPENLLINYVTQLITKGLPIIKKYMSNEVYIRLEENFKLLHRRENLVRIG